MRLDRRRAKLGVLGALLLVLGGCGLGGSASLAPTPTATLPVRPVTATVPMAKLPLRATPAPGVATPSPFMHSDVGSCNGTACNGADPDKTGCAYTPYTIHQADVPVMLDQSHAKLGELHLVGALSQSKCGSVQWAKVDQLPGLETFALRVVQCGTGASTTWREWDNRSEPAWSDMINSPGPCVWAEYGVRDPKAPSGWRPIALTPAH